MEKDNQWPNSCMSQVMVDQLKDMEKSNSMSHAILDMRFVKLFTMFSCSIAFETDHKS